MDSNGYNKSLFDTEQGRCYLCKRYGDTARHEVFGASSRSFSKALGLWVDLCPSCHNRVHMENDNELKEEGQRLFEKEYGHERFMGVFQRNYLEEQEWMV